MIMRTDKTMPVSEVAPFDCLCEVNLSFVFGCDLISIEVLAYTVICLPFSFSAFVLVKDWYVFSKMGNVTFRLSLTKTSFLTDD